MTKQESNLILAPKYFPVVSVPARLMPLPKINYTVSLDMDSLAIVRLFREVKNRQIPYVFAVLSKPGITQFPDRFYRVGVICSITTEDNNQIAFEGKYRVEATSPFRLKDDYQDSYWIINVKPINDEDTGIIFIDPQFKRNLLADLIKIRHLLRHLYEEGIEIWNFPEIIKNVIDDFETYDFGDKDDVDLFIWSGLSSIPEILSKDKQPFLASTSVLERITMLVRLIKEQIALLNAYKSRDEHVKNDSDAFGSNLNTKANKPDDQDQDKIFEKAHSYIKAAWARFKKVRNLMSEDAIAVAKEDLDRLLSYGGPKGNTYEWPKFKRRLDFLLDLPWDRQTQEESDITKVTRILEEDHYGLAKIKEKICDSIAPKLLNPLGRGQIICFVGPPGVGKTSLAKSIARALNRKLIRISVGGIRDESQIRGHDITYIGSQPGEILREIKRCGVKNPIFIIDEIDKLGRYSTAGDPSSAMLEVLDPEQNHSFKDHYLGCSFDLSRVMFIATANLETDIIEPLLDRMDIIRLSGYLEVEKIEIAGRYLIPRWTEEVGLKKNNVNVSWNDEVIPLLIRGYTNEAGVRNLDRNIADVLRKIAGRYLKSRDKNEAISSFRIEERAIGEFLGPVKFFKNKVRPTKVGEAIGLAWTPAGGEILYVQAEMYPRLMDKKVLARTGMQGKVMEESDEVAMTLLRNEIEKIDPELSKKLQNCSVHLHIPEGAVPKDGPSAGIAIFIALFSEVTGQVVRPNLAMTGEIDIKGRIMPVGGIREKVVAAERAGIGEVILPKENKRNIYDVPDSVKQNLRFLFLESVQEAIDMAFEKPE